MNYEPEIQKLFRKRQKSPQEIEYAQKRSESLFDIQTQKLALERKHHRSGRLSPSHTGTRESWNNMSEIRHELSDSTLLAKDYLEKIAENTYGAHKRMYGPSPTQLSRIKEAANENRGPFFGRRSYSVSKQRVRPNKRGAPHIENCCLKSQDTISKYGSLKNVRSVDQRRIFYSRGSKDNTGYLLCKEEERHLLDCLETKQARILNDEELDEACEKAYDRSSKECHGPLFGGSLRDAPPVAVYATKKNGQFLPCEHIRGVRGQSKYDGDKNEEKIQENMEKMAHLLGVLRRRNPQRNMRLAQDEYAQIVADYTGRKQKVSMY